MHSNSNPGLGIGLLVSGLFIFACQDAITLPLVRSMPIAQVLLIRFVAMLLFAWLLLGHHHKNLIQPFISKHPIQQIFRGLLIAVEIFIFSLGIQKLSLPQMHAVMATYPLVATLLAVPLLGESIGMRRIIALSLGFIGTLVILDPVFGSFSPYLLYPLACAILFGLYNVWTRKLVQLESAQTAFFYMALCCTLIFIGPAAMVWQPLTTEQILLVSLLCLTSIAAHVLYTRAFVYAPASTLQPYNYLLLVFASLVGLIVFKDVLSLNMIMGSTLVVGTGLYVWYRERLQKAQ